MTARFLACSALLTLSAAARAQDSTDLLQRTTAKVLQTVRRLPRYMCTQTIDRTQLEPTGSRPSSSCETPRDKQMHMTTSDRLRLDVAVTAGHEMYSWVTEGHFDNRSLFELVNNGALSTGAFASFLETVFRDDSATFSYAGEVTETGRKLVQFDYRVPIETSHYFFSGGGQRVRTGYFGSVFVDPATADLMRLVVQTEGLPPETGACESRSTLTYSRVQLNGADFLLPFRVQLHILNADGVELENTTTYSGCHEFLGESTVSFDDPSEAGGGLVSKGASAIEQLPAGLRFTVITSETINALTAAAGEKVACKLTAPVKDAAGRVYAPKGAAVSARILEIRKFYVPRTLVRLLIKLETIEIDGKSVRLNAKAELSPAPPRYPGSPKLEQRIRNATRDNADAYAAVLEIGNLVRDQIPIFESKWITAEANPTGNSAPRQ